MEGKRRTLICCSTLHKYSHFVVEGLGRLDTPNFLNRFSLFMDVKIPRLRRVETDVKPSWVPRNFWWLRPQGTGLKDKTKQTWHGILPPFNISRGSTNIIRQFKLLVTWIGENPRVLFKPTHPKILFRHGDFCTRHLGDCSLSGPLDEFVHVGSEIGI